MEAYLYQRLEDDKVQCNLCSHRCLIPEGKLGLCCVRQNRGGVLESLVYGRSIAFNADPIEKKPLFHVLPGSRSFSFATVGCNFRCKFCQNSDIAQMPRDLGKIQGQKIEPRQIVDAALKAGCKTIAYTYTEPTVFFEYAYDTAKLAKDAGIKNVFVTNGYQTPETIEMVAPVLDAANVDLKSFSDRFYKKMCGARLEPVLETLESMVKAGIFVEATTLIIPGLNDDPGELKELAEFLVQSLGPQTPWHVSRFHPSYKTMDRSPTSPSVLFQALETGKQAGLYYVYTGNIHGQGGENTGCHQCGELLIERSGFRIVQNNVSKGACAKCGAPAYGIWE